MDGHQHYHHRMRWLLVLGALVGVVLAARLLMSAQGGGSTILPPVFDPAVNVDATSTISSGVGGSDWVGRASIKRRDDGVLVMAYYRAERHDTNAGALHLRFSDDNGATWTAEDTKLGGGAVTGFPMNPPVSAGQDAGEPWIYLAPNGDLLIHMWRINYSVSMGGTYQSRSTDGGETWDSPAGPIQFAGLTVAQNNRTFATDDDFVFEGTIYAAARVYVDADGSPSASVFISSDDNGATWTRVSTIVSASDPDDGIQETGLEYVGNARIVAMLRDNEHLKSYQSISTDMGVTWSAKADVTSTVGIAGRQRVYTRAHLQGEDEWWEDNVLIMTGFVHQDPGDSQDRRNAVWVSGDFGDTWSEPFYIDSATEDSGYGDIFYDEANDQYVVVSYQGTLAAASLKQYRLTITGL
jgi:hypothetical protein